jgi:tetratricopeptide (TPR) repeat protein
LQHPNIVPVHNLGRLPDGRLYYTMKLVRGRTLADLLAAERNPSRLAGLLAVFEKVCEAVAFAHSRGVIHRDLKPANIMVGAFGEVQVMDWGLAKVLGRAESAGPPHGEGGGEGDTVRRILLAGSTVDNRGTGVVGTPAYMAPEQARGEAEAVDERADVFGLGAILCEALTGQPPYAGEGNDDALRQAARGDSAAAFARLNGCVADPELIALAKRCLAKLPGERPRDAQAVLDELRAHQEAQAARAREDRERRLAAEAKATEERRRRRVSLALAAVLLVAAIGSTAATVLFVAKNRQLELANNAEREQRQRAQQNEDRADEQRRRAETSYRLAREALGKCMQLKNDPRLRSGEMQQLQATLAQAEATFYQQFVQLPGAGPEFQAERARAFYDLAKVTDLLGKPQEAVGYCKQAVELYDELARGESPEPAYREKLATSLGMLGALYSRLEQWKEAERAFGEAYANASLWNRTDPENPSYQLLVAQSDMNLGIVYSFTGRREMAEKSHRSAVERLEKLATQHPTPNYRQHLAGGYRSLGEFYYFHTRGHLPDAQHAYERALTVLEELARNDPGVLDEGPLGRLYVNLVNLYKMTGKFGAAEDLVLRKAVPLLTKRAERHPAVPEYQYDLALAYQQLNGVYLLQDQFAKALVPCQRFLDILTRLVSQYPTDPNYVEKKADAETDMGNIMALEKKQEDAIEWFGSAIRTLTSLGSKSRNAKIALSRAYGGRAAALMELKRFAEATRAWDVAIAMETEVQGVLRNYYRRNRALALSRSGDYSKATAEVDALIQEGRGSPRDPESWYDYARTYALARASVLKNAGGAAAGREELAGHYAERAVHSLKQAEARGLFKDPTWVKKLSEDEDLESLRRDERYQEFLRKVRPRVNAGQ